MSEVSKTLEGNSQRDDYCPFGLTFNSYQRENSVEQRWKFQGQEHIGVLGLNWDSFKWRNHQPDIGRFFNIDLLAEKYVYNSPYAFSENKLISHRELEGMEARRSISSQEIGRQWTMGSDNYISNEDEGEVRAKTAKDAPSQDKEKEIISTLAGSLETSVNMSEDQDPAMEGIGRRSNRAFGTVPGTLGLSPRTVKGVGLGLSILNLALGASKVQDQIDEGGLGNVNPIDAAQVTVGGVGTFTSAMSMLGYGGSAASSVAASTNVIGLALSIPANWYTVYQGAYGLSEAPITSGSLETDQIMQLQYDQGFHSDQDYFETY